MRPALLSWALVLLAILAGPLSQSAAAAELTRDDVRDIVREMIDENPDIVIDAIRAYKEREDAAQTASRANAVGDNRDRLTKADGDPAVGASAADATVTVVEFFDYRCGYCKRMLGEVMAITEGSPDVRVVFKEFPVLGPDSVIAAKMSLAMNSIAPDRYRDFHMKLMGLRGELSEERILKLASTFGVERDELRQAMQDPAIESRISDTYELASMLGIRGTPAFVIGDTVIPGAVDRDTLMDAIATARKAG